MDIERVDRLLLRWSNGSDPLTTMEIARLWGCAFQQAALQVNNMLARGELELHESYQTSTLGQRQAARAYSPTPLLTRKRTIAVCDNLPMENER